MSEDRPLSVFHGRDNQLLPEMIAFYHPGPDILDCTANTRRMWKDVATEKPPTFMDIDPVVEPDVVGDFTAMPFPDETFDLIVFDPPHLPVAAASAESLAQMGRDFGLGRSKSGDNAAGFFIPFLVEASRVLRPDGLVFAKLKDYVHNHRYQWSLVDWIGAVRRTAGMTPCDLRVKVDPCGGNLKSGRWEKSHHARVQHCWWSVVRKGKCEPRRKL